MLKIFAIILLLLTFTQQSLAADLIIFADEKNKPKIFKNEKDQADGILADILTEVSKRSGLTFEYKFQPWARAYLSAISAKKGAIIGLSHTSERAKTIDYSTPMFVDDIVLFTRQDNKFVYNDINSLKGKIISTKIGVHYGDDYDNAISNKLFRIFEVDRRYSQFKMLELKRVDALLTGPSAHTGWEIIREDKELRH